MTRYLDRVLAGEHPSADEWREHLVTFHETYPGTTSRVFSSFVDDRGRSSYEVLVDSALNGGLIPTKILDVGCGDGSLLQSIGSRIPAAQLFGIDLSEADVALARVRFSAGDNIVAGDAGKMPFPDQRFDLVVSHLALMLIPNVGPALAEIYRVLAPGGRLAFVIDDPSATNGKLLETFRAVYRALVPEYPQVVRDMVADPRIYDPLSTSNLLGSLGFHSAPKTQSYEVARTMRGEELCEFIEATYLIGLLDQRALERVRTAMMTFAAEPVRLAMPLRLVVVDK